MVKFSPVLLPQIYITLLNTKNGIDIYKAKTLKQIDNFLTKKIPLCKYCDGSHLENYKKWAVSKKDIAEWLKISEPLGYFFF